ncbi:DNA replication factor Cdt1 [Pieris brassicae]|uniref:DNA replication factor Cdt1 n=1 Tax=Pieris brassicae TaxID=7116 RepID=UPI001E65E722|nr:DNA replication factor Cdt1 [Pieris brassicae]
MSQTTLTKFYNTRKRPAADEIVSSKNKVPHIDRKLEISKTAKRVIPRGNCEAIKAIVKTVTVADTSSQLSNTPQDNGIEASINKVGEKEGNSTVFSKKNNCANAARNNASKADLVTSARKELSLGDIRKKLASSSRLAELKSSADRITKGIQELKDKTVKKNLKEFSSIDVALPQSPSKRNQIQKDFLSPKKDDANISTERPLMSPRKVFVSPVKSPTKVPAYLRHASLLSSSSGPLPLPHHYRFLAEHFRGMETVVALLYNRNETITFAKLKPSIQEMLKRTFSEKHLAQIKYLVPDFYNFEIQKIRSFNSSSNRDAYELVISPNFPTDIKVMNPSVLLERRRYFYDTLLKEVKKHHSQYLSTLDPPIDIPDKNLVRWHPEFEIEKIPEIEGAKLPEMPNVDKMSSAQDVLAKARELFKCNTKMGRALEKLAQAKARGLTEQEKEVTGLKDTNHSATQTSQPSTSNVTLINPALRNLPASLLEKVKAKQAAKALETMTRSTETEQKYVIYTRLPDLARTLRNIFVTERKNVLALNIILSKLDSSFKSHVSSTDLQRDIKILTETVPKWVQLHEIRNTSYLKLDKITDLKLVVAKLEAQAAKYKRD